MIYNIVKKSRANSVIGISPAHNIEKLEREE
jgi:D-alanine-D-alanine ligase-like ATP-grasp enzyme